MSICECGRPKNRQQRGCRGWKVLNMFDDFLVVAVNIAVSRWCVECSVNKHRSMEHSVVNSAPIVKHGVRHERILLCHS